MRKILDRTDRQMTASYAAFLLNTPGRGFDALDEINALIASGHLAADVWAWGASKLTAQLRAMAYGIA